MDSLRARAAVILVDMHGEATSEKVAMGRHLDGRVSAVIGSHTHVQTADEGILPGGTAYLTDAGMCGPEDSVLGVRTDRVIARFLTQLPTRFDVAAGPVIVQGAVIDVDATRAREAASHKWNDTQKVQEHRDGSVRLTFTCNEFAPVVAWILRFGSHAIVIKPAALAEVVVEQVRATERLYGKRRSRHR